MLYSNETELPIYPLDFCCICTTKTRPPFSDICSMSGKEQFLENDFKGVADFLTSSTPFDGNLQSASGLPVVSF